MLFKKRVSKSRNYDEENKECNLKSVPVKLSDHPLKPILEPQKPSKDTLKSPLDPLADATLDPLSKMVADVSQKAKVTQFINLLTNYLSIK